VINKKALRDSDFCGCYTCLERFLTEYIDPEDIENGSVFCPFCDEETIIPLDSRDGISFLNLSFLSKDLVPHGTIKKWLKTVVR
jgi:hypothetical protein